MTNLLIEDLDNKINLTDDLDNKNVLTDNLNNKNVSTEYLDNYKILISNINIINIQANNHLLNKNNVLVSLPTENERYYQESNTNYTNTNLTNLVNANFAYYYVNYFKKDNYTGWFFDLLTGNLQLFTDYDNINLPMNTDNKCAITRSYLLSKKNNLSNIECNNLRSLNKLWKISKKAYIYLKENPSKEGENFNIDNWILFIQNANNLQNDNLQFVILAIEKK